MIRATETPGSLTPDALRAVTEARDQVRTNVASIGAPGKRALASPDTVGGKEKRVTSQNVGYESSIMAALGGRVDRTMIDRLVEQHVSRMNVSGQTSYDAGIDNERGNHL